MKAEYIDRPTDRSDGQRQARLSALDRLAALSIALTRLQREADSSNSVGVGAGDVVDLVSLDDGSEARVEVVAADVGKWRSGTTALTSPLGKALAGRKPAELVEVTFMGWRMRFLILRVLPAAQVAAGEPRDRTLTPWPRRAVSLSRG